MITVLEFRQWLGYAFGGSPGRKAVGLLRFTKRAGFENMAFTIEKGQTFSAGGFKFETVEGWQISESRTDPLEIAVQSVLLTARANIPANANWDSEPIIGLAKTNDSAFTLGRDVVESKPGTFPDSEELGPQDSILEFHLNAAKKVCWADMALSPDDTFPEEDERVREAVYLLAMYRLENNTTQGRSTTAPEAQIPDIQQQIYFRAKVYGPLMQQVRRLLSHRVNWGNKINGKPTPSSIVLAKF